MHDHKKYELPAAMCLATVTAILSLLGTPAHSALWPIATSVDITVTGPYDVKYDHIQWSWLDIAPDRFVPFMEWVGAGHRHNPWSGPYPLPGSNWYSHDEYMGICRSERGCDAVDLVPHLPDSLYHSGTPYGGECIGVRSFHMNGETFEATRAPDRWSCLTIPPANQWCNITTPQITLDHGTLALEDAASHSANTPVSIEYTAPMSISLILGDLTDTVKMTGGITSKLSVDNKPLGSVLKMNAGTQHVTLSDQLSAGPGGFAAGFYQGSAVLKLLYE